MSRDVRLFVEDMLIRVQRIGQIRAKYSESEFVVDELAYEATLRNIEILGEAAKNVPEDVRQAYPEVPWRLIAKTRDVLAHVYFGVKHEIIWDVKTVKAPELEVHLQRMLAEWNEPIS